MVRETLFKKGVTETLRGVVGDVNHDIDTLTGHVADRRQPPMRAAWPLVAVGLRRVSLNG